MTVTPLLICLLDLAAHACLYFCVLRDWPVLGTEKGIFLYHFISAMAVSAAFAIWAVADGFWTWFACVVVLHGIYSLTFLELWALADDSYSLAMMQAIDRNGGVSGAALSQALQTIGARKQASRLGNLKRIGLLHQTSDGFVMLTCGGRAALFAGRCLLFLVNVRKYG